MLARSRPPGFAVVLIALGACGGGCGGDEARGPKEPVRPAPRPQVQPSPPKELPSDDAGRPASRRDAAPPAQQRYPGTRFPPASFQPPHERSAQPGDGKWTPLGEPPDRAAQPPHVLYRTTVHPHPQSRFLKVTVVAVDLRHATVHLVAGTEEPKAPAIEKDERSGMVADRHRDDVLAVFNGGFQAHHGWWGMMLGGKTFIKPRKDGCTIALYADGTVRLRSWPALEATTAEMTGYRQTPPCLLEKGEIHSRLRAGNDRAWGGHHPDRKTRRRSAVGMDASGRVFFYALGEEVNPRYLAEGLRHAGAEHAAQLDINWNWTRFLLVGDPKGEDTIGFTSSLLPQMNHGKTEYLLRPTKRDFFYIARHGQ